LNGSYVPEAEAKVSVFDRALLFGDGIYEVTAVLDGRLVDFEPVMRILEETGALGYARDRAVVEGRKAVAALDGLPPSPHAQSLLQLATFAADRAY